MRTRALLILLAASTVATAADAQTYYFRQKLSIAGTNGTTTPPTYAVTCSSTPVGPPLGMGAHPLGIAGNTTTAHTVADALTYCQTTLSAVASQYTGFACTWSGNDAHGNSQTIAYVRDIAMTYGKPFASTTTNYACTKQ